MESVVSRSWSFEETLEQVEGVGLICVTGQLKRSVEHFLLLVVLVVVIVNTFSVVNQNALNSMLSNIESLSWGGNSLRSSDTNYLRSRDRLWNTLNTINENFDILVVKTVTINGKLLTSRCVST